MKTPDSISKLRQRTFADIRKWKSRIAALEASNPTNETEKEFKSKQLIICRTGLLKSSQVLDIIKSRLTRSQKLAGWGSLK